MEGTATVELISRGYFGAYLQKLDEDFGLASRDRVTCNR